MVAHETVFNGGRPLPHRALDRLIMDRIAQGQWAVVGQQDFEGADWILIRTRNLNVPSKRESASDSRGRLSETGKESPGRGPS